MKDYFRESIGGAVEVEFDQVEIASFEAGSVVVEAQIIGLKDEQEAEEVADIVQKMADENTLLDENDFGVYSVADVAVVSPIHAL